MFTPRSLTLYNFKKIIAHKTFCQCLHYHPWKSAIAVFHNTSTKPYKKWWIHLLFVESQVFKQNKIEPTIPNKMYHPLIQDIKMLT